MAAGTPPPLLAEVTDLGLFLGEDIETGQTGRAEYLLRIASQKARRHCGRTWLDADGDLEDVPEEVAGIVVQAAARVFLNVEGYTAEGDADYNYQRGGNRDEAGTVYFTPGEQATLDAYAVQRRRSGLYSIGTTRADSAGLPDENHGPLEYDPFNENWPAY